MNLPTTNLLEWIDERIEWIESQSKKSIPFDAYMNIRKEELQLMKIRILQERENEKEVIVKSHSDGVVDAILVEINECKISSETYYQQTYKSIQTTFNPNK